MTVDTEGAVRLRLPVSGECGQGRWAGWLQLQLVVRAPQQERDLALQLVETALQAQVSIDVPCGSQITVGTYGAL